MTRMGNDGSAEAFTNKWRIAAICAAVVSFSAALAVTSGYGPGLDPDSMAYIGASRSLAEHGELRVPIGKWQRPDTSVTLTVWPPAFPVTLAAPQLLGVAPLTSARIVLALSAAVTIGGVILLLCGAVPIAAAVIAVAAIAVTPSFVTVHITVLSEPLFLAFLTMTLLGMAREKFGLAGFAAAGAVMTRYAGISAGGAVAIWFFCVTRGSLGDKLKRAAISAAPSVIAFILWMAHNARVQTVQSSTRISYYPGIAGTVKDGLSTATGWLAPSLTGHSAEIAAAIVLILLVAGIAVAFRRRGFLDSHSGAKSWKIVEASALLLASYLAVIILSRAFLGGTIQFDARILSPAFLLIELMLAPVIYLALRPARGVARAIGVAAMLVWIAASVTEDVPVVKDATQDGNDFAASDWRDSPTLAWLKSDASGRPIYTNWPAAVYFDGGRAAYDLPNSVNPDTVKLFAATIVARKGIFLAFNDPNPDYPPTDSLAKAAHLIEFRKFSDGIVWIPANAGGPTPQASGATR